VRMSNPQGKAATQQTINQTELSKMLAGESIPMFEAMFGSTMGQLAGGPDQIAPFIRDAFGKARDNVNTSYSQANRTGSELTKYRALTADSPYTQGEVTGTIGQMGYGLEQERQQGLRTLNFQEAQTGLQGYNALLNTLGGGANNAMQLGAGAAGLANQGIAGLPTMSRGGSIGMGALSGAAAGTTVAPGWGTLIGAIVGAAGGAIRGG
jgi:hypothetical protein